MSSMKRMSFDSYQDRKVANDYLGVDSALGCSARGCPSRWSIDMGGRLCTAHAAAQPHDWDRVSDDQRHAETERARRGTPYVKPPPQYSMPEKLEMLRRLASVFKAKPDRQWIADLQARRVAGDYLTAAQRDMLRDMGAA